MELFVLIFTRWGLLVPVLFVPSLIVANAICDRDSMLSDHAFPELLTLIWGVSCILASNHFDKPDISEMTGEELKKEKSSWFLIPMKIWGYLILAFCVAVSYTEWGRHQAEWTEWAQEMGVQLAAQPKSPMPSANAASAAQAPVAPAASRETPQSRPARLPTAFDCNKKALGVDFVICGSPTLLSAEADLEDAYRNLRQAYPDARDQQTIKDSQRKWSLSYGPACGLPAKGEPSSTTIKNSSDCVLKAINGRVATLNHAYGDAAANSEAQAKPTPTTSNAPTFSKQDMQQAIAAIRGAPDAVSLRCVFSKDTNIFIISESLQSVYRTNVAVNDADVFIEGKTWVSDGQRFRSRAIFEDNSVTFGTLMNGEPVVSIALDRTTLVVSATVFMMGIMPLHDGGQCQRISSRKQL